MLCKQKRIAAECLIPTFVTLLIFSGVLFSKGIFPFGENLIDYYDMGQTNAPLYYHIWDFLHGRSALFFDWYINCGQNLAMGSAIQWNISPFNLFFLLIPRELTYPSLSVFMGLHLFFMSFNMALFLRNVFPKLQRSMLFISAVSYGLCGYTLTHYTIPTYLDTAVFFPIFALSLMRLLRGGGRVMYVLMLGFMSALSYYLGFMHLIYVLLFSGVYITLNCSDKTVRQERAADLAVGTAAGILLSFFMLLPSVMQMTLSSRFNSNLSGGVPETLMSILNSVGADEYYIKYFQLYALEFFIVLIIAGVIFCRKERRFVITVLSAVFIPCALIPFESINILWHFGTYYHYPIRCGYLIPFSVIAAAACFAERAEGKEAGDEIKGYGDKKVYIILTAASVLISAAALIILIRIYDNKAPWDIRLLFSNSALLWIAVCIMLTTMLLLLRSLKKLKGSRLNRVLIRISMPVVIAELILGAYVGYGLPKFTDRFFADPEQSGEYILKAEAFSSASEGCFTASDESFRTERLKNPDTDLNTNYGMVIRHATVTGWANTATGEMIKCAEKLGYSTHFMRILDSGGTLLTDSLLQVKDIVTAREYENDIQEVYINQKELKTTEGEYYLYHNAVSLPFALAVPHTLEEADLTEGSVAENNNLLYKALSGDTENIANVIKISELKNNSRNNGNAVEIEVSGKKALYLCKGKAEEIRVNGRTVAVPSIGDPENKAYPAWFNSNLLFLGIFENRTVVLNCPEKSRIITIDIDKLKALSGRLNAEEKRTGAGTPEAAKSSISFSITGDQSRNRVLIPLSFSPGWSARVNGENRSLKDFGGLFMVLPIDQGENRVELSFSPPGLKAGILITILTLILTLALVYINKARAVGSTLLTLISPALYYLYYFLFISAALVLYLIPLGWFAVHELSKILR